jgi:uncharacterized lipoprotein YehR (DUF1307 family)
VLSVAINFTNQYTEGGAKLFNPIITNFTKKNKIMKKRTTTLFLVAATLLLSACQDKNEDVTQSVNKNGAIESSVTVEHLDSTKDILVTKHIVWSKGQENKTIAYRDTVPALGYENVEAENQDGDTKKLTKQKDYEIFITVK